MKSFKIISVLLIFSLIQFTLSCERNISDEAPLQTPHLETIGKLNRVNLEDVPILIPSITQFYARSRTMRTVGELDLDLTKIVEYIGANSIKTYSIPINKRDFQNDDYYFENLNIVVKNNQDAQPIILKYNPEDDSKPVDLTNFTGKIEFIDIDKTTGYIIELLNGANRFPDQEPPILEEGSSGGGFWGWLNGSWDGNDLGGNFFTTLIHDIGMAIGNSCGCNDPGEYFSTSAVLINMPFIPHDDSTPSIPNYDGQGNSSGNGGSSTPIVLSHTIPNWSIELSNQHIMANLVAGMLNFNTVEKNWLKQAENFNTLHSAYYQLIDGDYIADRITLVRRVTKAIIEFKSQYGSLANQETIAEYLNAEYMLEDMNVDNVDLISPPPSCTSFNFVSRGSNWQEAAVKNIGFNVAIITPQGIFGNIWINYPQPIIFGAPKNLLVGNTEITPGHAATVSAHALSYAMKATVKKFGNKPCSEIMRQFILKKY